LRLLAHDPDIVVPSADNVPVKVATYPGAKLLYVVTILTWSPLNVAAIDEKTVPPGSFPLPLDPEITQSCAAAPPPPQQTQVPVRF
jgi:hypothetical protein